VAVDQRHVDVLRAHPGSLVEPAGDGLVPGGSVFRVSWVLGMGGPPKRERRAPLRNMSLFRAFQ